VVERHEKLHAAIVRDKIGQQEEVHEAAEVAEQSKKSAYRESVLARARSTRPSYGVAS
jgi:hypothetical protein